jgi:cytoskeleton protein RodZ
LELLEADRLDLLPDAVFVRALASSVCRALKIDAAPVLKLLPQTSAPRLDTEERGINTPFHAAGDFKARTLPAFVTRPAALWVAALLVGVLVVAFFPESGPSLSSTAPAVAPVSKDTVEVAAAPVQSSTAVQPNAAPQAPSSENAKPVETPKPVAEIAPPTAAPVTAPVVAPAVSKPVVPVNVPANLPVASAASVAGGGVVTGGVVTLKAKGETWVEVTDSKGVVQVRKILAAGEVASASGAMPLSVVIGRADMTSVEVRGQAFSLDAISKDNVARFEVK